MSPFVEWWMREGKFYDPDTEDVSWDDKREGLAERAFHVATVQSGNYTTNNAIDPTEVVFSNGRRVWIENGALQVGWKREYVDPETGLSGNDLDRMIDAAHKRTILRGSR